MTPPLYLWSGGTLQRAILPFIVMLWFVLEPLAAWGNAEIDVRFTNPECPSRPYKGYIAPTVVTPEASGSGIRFSKPELVSSTMVPLRNGTSSRSGTREGTYCFRQDSGATDSRPDSVFQKLKSLIDELEIGDRIQISTFSFSNRSVSSLLCDALARGAAVELVTGSESPLAESLESGRCGGNKALWIDASGDAGRLQHAKFILFRINGAAKTTVSFQSANISSGVSLHHENWTFVEAQSDDPFVQKHVCQFDALKTAHFNAAASSLSAFRDAYSACLSRITAASDLGIEPFFVPALTDGASDGKRAMESLVSEISEADQVDVISHRLTNRRLVNTLVASLGQGKRVRIIMDDEVFWVGNSAIPRDAAGQPLFTTNNGFPLLWDDSGLTVYDHYGTVARLVRRCEHGASFFPNEYEILQRLVRAGAELRYIEANHRDQLFQHNKFLVMSRSGKAFSVFTGAGNLSQAAFTRNGENFYLMKASDAVRPFALQFDRMWNTMATASEDLPITWVTEISGDRSWSNWSARVLEKKRHVCR